MIFCLGSSPLLVKDGRSPRHDNLEPEHVCYAGKVCKLILTQLFNALLSLEGIPPLLKFRVITPLYKGKERTLYCVAATVVSWCGLI